MKRNIVNELRTGLKADILMNDWIENLKTRPEKTKYTLQCYSY
jgi:hypothetical protein